jgi:hypothetical protein
MTPRLLPLAALILAACPAAAQSPPPWAYYPLGVGDVWEYAEPMTGNTLRVRNARDTVITGRRYVIQERLRFDAGGAPIAQMPPFYRLRYDTLSTHVVEPFTDGSGTEVPSRPAPCPFGANGSQTVDCGPFGGAATVRPFVGTLTIGDTVLTDARFKEYETVAAFVVYAAGIGEAEYGSKGTPYRYLTYARVGGVEYGAPRYPVPNEPGPAPDGGVALRAWPNPFTDVLHVEAAGEIRGRVEVYDTLGRRVASVVGEGHADVGPPEATLDLSGLTPGVYLLRAVVRPEGGAARVLTQRLTLVR